MTDVIVVGGGVIGLSVAYELAGRGRTVCVIDQGPLGQEASWAGAGMLPPGNPARAQHAEARLRAASHVLWPQLSRDLLEQTGIDNGFRRCGGWELSFDYSPERLQTEVRAWRNEGVEVEELNQSAVRQRAPHLSDCVTGAYVLAEMGQVRNPRHLKALAAAAALRGVQLLPGTPCLGFERGVDRIQGVRILAETLRADQYVICSGAWSRGVLTGLGFDLALHPVRGQMVLLESQPLLFRQILCEEARYLVPRADGRILVGSTEEQAGFDKRNTAGGIAGLIDFATRLVPALADAKFARAWAGLRPRGCDSLPYLGRVPETENLFIAAGHFRAGLQLSPITGLLLAQLLMDERPQVPLEPYSCQRGSRPKSRDV